MVYWLAVGWLCRRRLGLGLEELSGTCRRTDGPLCTLYGAYTAKEAKNLLLKVGAIMECSL
jgi:hypothetical protein